MRSHEQYAAAALRGEVSLEGMENAQDRAIADLRAVILGELRKLRPCGDAAAPLVARLRRQLHRVNTDVAAALREVDRADCVRGVLGVLGPVASVGQVARWLDGLYPPGHPSHAAAAEVARRLIREAAEGVLRTCHEGYEDWLMELGGAAGEPEGGTERSRALGRRIIDTRVAVEQAMRALLRGAGQGPG